MCTLWPLTAASVFNVSGGFQPYSKLHGCVAALFDVYMHVDPSRSLGDAGQSRAGAFFPFFFFCVRKYDTRKPKACVKPGERERERE